MDLEVCTLLDDRWRIGIVGSFNRIPQSIREAKEVDEYAAGEAE
jgi:hypothetical protein